jgi:hypothetical protein
LTRCYLRERFDVYLGDCSCEGGETLASVKVMICQFELVTRLIELGFRREQIGVRLIECGLRRNALFEKFLFALEVRVRVANLGFSLLDCGAGLFNLSLQRARIYFRQDISQLDLLADLKIHRFELPGNLKRQSAYVGRLQNARKIANTALSSLGYFVRTEPSNRLFFSCLVFTAVLQNENKAKADQQP